jgi:TonB family protein
MAPPKELAPLLPDTLPEDFNEWDGKSSAARSSVHPGEREAWEAADSFGETQKPLWQSSDREAYLASLVDGPRASASASSAPVFLKQQENLVDWNSEATSPWSGDNTEWEEWEAAHSLGKTPKSNGQSAGSEAFLSPVVQKPGDSDAAAPAPVTAKQQESTSEPVDESPSVDSYKAEAHHVTPEVPVASTSSNVAPADGVSKSPEPAATTRRKAEEVVYQLFSEKKVEATVEKKISKKTWITIGAISAGAILLPLVLMMTVFHHGTKSVAAHSVQPLPGASNTAPMTETPDPSATKPAAQGKPLPTTGKPQTADNQPTSEENGTTSAQPQPTAMNDQLTAPTRIPKQEAENAPPPASLDTSGADGMGGNANTSMFNGHTQPNVRVASLKPVAISSGVATGMLIQKTQPDYPPIAKTAHVAGTVELHATISTDGTIKDLHAVSGPVMLRQAALDAVRNWRYKPYRLNNQPVEVETTINVVFNLGG